MSKYIYIYFSDIFYHDKSTYKISCLVHGIKCRGADFEQKKKVFYRKFMKCSYEMFA